MSNRAIIIVGCIASLLASVAAQASLRTLCQPKALPEEVHLQLSEEVIAAGETLWFQGTLLGTSPTSKALYVEVLNRQTTVLHGIYPVEDGIATGQILLPDTLSNGLYQVRAYTQWMRNSGVASFEFQPLLVVNPNKDKVRSPSSPAPPASGQDSSSSSEAVSNEIQIRLDKANYCPREPMSIQISVPSSAGARGAVSIRKVSPAAAYMQSTQPPVRKDFREPKGVKPNERFRREDEGLTVSGRVGGMDPQTQDRMILLSVPGQSPYFEYDFADQEGRFQIPVKQTVVGAQEVILQTADTSLHVQWTLDEKFATENTYAPESLPVLSEPVLAAVGQSYRDRAQIMVQYDLYHTPDSAAVSSKTNFRFYGAPNFTIRADDYIALPNFIEVNRELMPGVRLRKNRGEYDLDIFDIATRNFLEGEPSVFIDGVLIHDVKYLVDMPPSEIELIETVNRRTYYGEYRMDGTVAIYTKAGDGYLPALPSSAIRRQLTLYTSSQPFSAPDLPYHEPDFRTLLYWQTDVTLSSESYTLSVDNADELGEFEVVVEGITVDGHLIHGRYLYTVSLDEAP